MDQHGRYEVFPEGDEWSYRHRSSGGKITRGDNFALRSDAIAAARADRGDVREETFRRNDDGEYEFIGSLLVSRGPESLVLLRPDGEVYGEIDHEIRAQTSENPQVVTLEPALDSGEAGME